MNVGIVGTGSYLPPNILTSTDLAAKLNITEEWILEKTGIYQRHIAGPDEAASDLALAASRRALNSCQLSPSAIDLIILATSTGDQPVPATACRVQSILEANNSIPLDVSAGCSGFLYALRIGRDMLMASPDMRYALIIGSEVTSRFVDYTDKRTCVLFGDGAGAVVLTKVHSGGIIRCVLGADGHQGAEFGGVPGGGSRMPASSTTLASGSHYLRMNGRRITKWVGDTIFKLFFDMLEPEKLSASEMRLVVPHQPNGKMLDEWPQLLGLRVDQVYKNVQKVGNTSSASIPIALDQAAKDSNLRFGELILFLAVGGGGTWGATLLRWCLGDDAVTSTPGLDSRLLGGTV